jgi:hypothetical protein
VNIEEIAQRKQRNIVQGKALFSRIEAIQAKGASRADMDAITPEYKAWEAERQSVDAQERAQEFARKMGGDFTPTPAAQPFLPEAAVKSLWQAAKSRQSLRLDSKDFRANADLKAGPFGTGGFTAAHCQPRSAQTCSWGSRTSQIASSRRSRRWRHPQPVLLSTSSTPPTPTRQPLSRSWG